MTKGKLLEVLDKYSDECEIVIESHQNYNECKIIRVRTEYSEIDNFALPQLILEYKEIEEL